MKKKLTEAQVTMSIADLSSSDLQTLSQMLALAGQAEQAAGLMGGMGGIGGMDAVGGLASDPLADPMAGGIDAPGGIGENGPLAMAGPDDSYGMDSGLDLNAGADDGLGMDDGLGLGDDLGLDDGMGADMGADMGMDDGLGLDDGMGDDLGLDGGDDMGADEFDLTMGDLGGTDIDDDAMVEESFNRLFALCGLNESEEAEDEEVIEEDESAMEGEEVISEEAEEDLDEASAPVIALDLNDPQMKQMVGDIDVPGAADHAGMSGFPAAGAAAKPEIQHAVPSAQTQHPGMAAPGEEDSMDWLNVPSAGGPTPSTAVGSAGTQHQGVNPAKQQGQLSPMGQPAKPTWMEEMSEDMDVFEEVEEDEESEELEEGQMYDFSLDEDAVEEMKSPGLGDNRMFGPYANAREAANDARTECPAGVVGRDFQIINRPNGVFWKKIVTEDVANSRPKIEDVCTSGIENSVHAIEKVPGKVGDNTLKFMEAQDVNTIHASLNEQFELFMKGKK